MGLVFFNPLVKPEQMLRGGRRGARSSFWSRPRWPLELWLGKREGIWQVVLWRLLLLSARIPFY